MPSRIEQKRAEEAAQRKAALAANSPKNIELEDSADPDVAFRDVAQPESAEELEAFNALEPAPPPEPQPFSRDGRDYYVDPTGKLKSVEAGFDAATEYPGLQPATAEQVRARDIQKRSGSGWDMLSAGVETGAATLAETAAGVHNAANNLLHMWPDPADNVNPEQIAPFAYTDPALERREANPKSALAGGIAADLVANVAVRGAGGGAMIRRAMLGGLTGEGIETALTGEPYSVGMAGVYGLGNALLDAVSHVQWGEAMRALGKRSASALDESVRAAQEAALRDAAEELDPVLQADKLRKNAGPIIEQAQSGFDETLTSIEERMSTAPDKMFRPGVLAKTVTGDVAAQGERALDLAVKLEHAAIVTGQAEVESAGKLLSESLGDSGAKMFSGLRAAGKALSSIEARSPLIDELSQAIEETLADEKLWGRAAKHHTAMETLAAGTKAGSGFKLDNLAEREELDFMLEQARKVASTTGDKTLLKLIRDAEQHVANADRALGARLLGPELPPPAPPLTLAQKAAKAMVTRAGHAATGALVGGLGGSVIGGTPGAIIGAGLGNVVGNLASPLIERAANFVARVPKSAAERAAEQTGKRWTSRLYGWAKGAAKRNPTKIAGAALLAGSALTDDPDQQTAGASVGLLSFFLPRGGRAQLAKELGTALQGLTARERMAVRIATERSAASVEEMLYKFARGERELQLPGHDATYQVPTAKDLFDLQFSAALAEFDRNSGRAVKAGVDIGTEIPEHVRAAVQADVAARSAALIDNDRFLKRLAKPGLLDELKPSKERSPLEVAGKQLEAAQKALTGDDMPREVGQALNGAQHWMQVVMGRDARPGLESTLERALERFENEVQSGTLGRPINKRERAYVRAALRNVVEARVESNALYHRQSVRAVEPLPAPGRPPPSLHDSFLSFANTRRASLDDYIAGARRGDYPSQDLLERNPQKFLREWQDFLRDRGATPTGAEMAWAKSHLLDPVYEYLGRQPTAGDALPRAVRDGALVHRDHAQSNPAEYRPRAQQYFDNWKADAELRLSRDLTPEELAWGKSLIVDSVGRPQLGVLEGEATPEVGAGADFRRLGLPEPQQGEVPIQMKLGLPPRERPVTIEGSPPLNLRLSEERRAAALTALQEEDLPVEDHQRMRNLQGRLRDAIDLRLETDADLRARAERFTDAVSAESQHPPLNPRAREYVQATFEGSMQRYREQQLQARPLNADERAQHAYNHLREVGVVDLPGLTAETLEKRTRELRGRVIGDRSPEELRQLVRDTAERFGDEFVLSQRRKPNARERAYVEAHLSNEAAVALERELSYREARLRDEQAAQARIRQREIDEKIARQRTAAEEARVAELMGGLDLPEERQEAIARRYDKIIGDKLRAQGLDYDSVTREQRRAAVSNYDVIEALRAQPEGLTPGEEVFVHDQLGTPGFNAETELRDAISERVALDDSFDPTDATPDLELDDLLKDLERSGGFSPWEEYQLRQVWEEQGSRLTRAYEEDIDSLRRERKQEYKDEHPPESDPYGDDDGGNSYGEADGFPDIDEIRSIGIGELRVEDSRGAARVFGQHLSIGDLEELFALNQLAKHFPHADLKVTIHRNSVEFEAHGGGVQLQREFRADSDGFVVSHSYFRNSGKPGEGVMKEIFRSAVPTYKALGGSEVHVSCIEVGRYAWPNLGFRGTPRQEKLAIDTFFDLFLRGRSGLDIGAEETARLKSEIGTLRDLSDATVPVELVRDNFGMMQPAYSSAVGGRTLPFEEAFVKDGRMKIGKYFLITNPGEWNSELVLRLDDSEWYREFLSRIGLMSASGLGFKELLEAWGNTDQKVITREPEQDELDAEPAELPPSEAEHQAHEQTRSKLDFLHEQTRTLTQTTARAITGPTQKTRTIRVVPGVTQSAGVTSFLGGTGSLAAAYEQKKATLQRIARDPLALVNELSDGLGEVSDAAPDLHRGLVQKTYEVVAFLQGKVPSTIGASLTRPDGSPPTSTALRQFALYYSAATNPSSVFVDLANNRARKEQVDTLKQLWPDQYAALQVAAMQQLAESRPTLAQRSRLDLLFGLGANLDRALSPRLVAARDAYRDEQAQKAQDGAGGPMPSRRTNPSIAGADPLARLSRGTAAA